MRPKVPAGGGILSPQEEPSVPSRARADVPAYYLPRRRPTFAHANLTRVSGTYPETPAAYIPGDALPCEAARKT
jgi:hypothetical protein